MTIPALAQPEIQHQLELLSTSVGQQGSGALRYGAAMFFYNMGLVSDEMLEIYRRCAKFDREDPVDLARFEGVRIVELTPADLKGLAR